jgi:hypothetical protein
VSDYSPTSADDVADCLETYVLSSSQSATGISRLQEFADDYLQVGDAAFTFAINRMRQRKDILGTSYPFEFDISTIVRNPEWLSFAYVHFLLLSGSALATIEQGDSSISGPEQWFEELCLDSIVAWLGPDAVGLRFGWPSDLGRPPEFPEAIRWLSEKMRIDLGTAYRPPIRKDGGVDVIAWRPFGDNRSGFPIVLVQGTLQKDLLSKARDVDVLNWSGWLALDRPPMTALATPRIVPESTDRWNQLSRQTLVFERIRLSRTYPGDVSNAKYGKLIEASKRALDTLRESLEN